MTVYRAAFLAGLVLAAPLATTGCGGKGEAEEAGADTSQVTTLGTADVATVGRATLFMGVPLSGSLEPRVNVVVGAPLAEQVAEMFVDEGTAVRQGQPVARFRDDVLRAAAASADADRATARTQVSIAAAESTRAGALFAEGAIAQRDRDNAFLGLELARARLTLAEAQAASAHDRLETATVRSPVSGVVSRRHAQAGDRVDFGKPVLEIVDPRVLQLTASVEAQWLGDLRVGRPVRLSVTQLAGDTIEGRVARINPTADPATRQVRIYVDVPNEGGRLVGGLFVSGRVVVREARNVVAVPAVAVRALAAEHVVWVVENGRLAKRRVTPGVEDRAQGLIEITAGLSGGETVIVGPVEGLAEGARAEVAARPGR